MAENWDAALARLEADVADIERALAERVPAASTIDAAQLCTWVPPRGLGPMPEHLVGRARALADAQARVTHRLDLLRTSAVHQLTALRAIPSTGEPSGPAPVFVDVHG